jgi:hypothetical protein
MRLGLDALMTQPPPLTNSRSGDYSVLALAGIEAMFDSSRPLAMELESSASEAKVEPFVISS